MGRRVLKICGSSWANESRDKRELSVYRDLGDEVLVLAKGGEKDKGREGEIDGFRVLYYSTRPLGTKVPNPINRLISLFTWAHYARQLKPDVISGHDLMPGLTIAWMSTLFCKNKPKLIYDAHEFELGRDTNGKRGKLTNWLLGRWEKFLMKRCAFSIMVNDSIADEVQRIHKLTQRPVVVRSTPNYWEIDERICQQTRQDFLEAIRKTGKCVEYLLMYHGQVSCNRGIECVIKAVAGFDDVGLVILGNGEESYVASLHRLAESCGVEEKVLFHPAVPIDELWKYVGAADLSLMMIAASARSYYLCLPNKFFESIQSLTPIVSSNFPEMRRIIDQYQIGLTCDPNNLKEINNCVERMKTDQAFYAQCKENLKRAKEELCWEKEKLVLINAYEQMLN